MNLLLFSRWRPKGTFISRVLGPGSESTDPHLRVHSAVQLAGAIRLDGEEKRPFKDEYLFEWEIPERYVVHTLSLQTYDRGFRTEPYAYPISKAS